MDQFHLKIQFPLEPNQRNHDLGFHLNPLLLNFRGSFEHRAGLHLGDFRIYQAQATATESEHRIELVQLFDALGDLVNGDAHFLRQQILRGVIVR